MQTETPTPSRRPRRWLSFSLRSLLVLMVLSALGLGGWQRYYAPYVKQRAAADALTKMGAQIQLRPVGWAWERRLLGENQLQDVVSVHLEATAVQDQDLRWLEDLPNLERLYLARNPQLTDAGMRHLAGLRRLRRLSLWRTGITDAGIGHLAGLRELRVLDIQRQGTTACLEHLQDLDSLQKLRFNFPVDDRGAEILASFPNLEVTYLATRGLSDRGAADAARLGLLETLVIEDGTVTDAGLAPILRCPKLTTLYLTICPISDASVVLLPEQLDYVHMIGTNVTLDGLALRYGGTSERMTIDGQHVTLRVHRDSRRYCSVRFDPLSDEQPLDLKSLPQFKQLQYLSMMSRSADESFLQHLGGFPHLESLEVALPLSEAGVADICQASRLRHLRIALEQDLTPASLELLAAMDQLESLDLSGTRLRGAQLDFLQRMPQLTVLNLAGNPLADADLARVAGLNRLERLNISFCQELGDGALVHLQSLNELVDLSAQYTQITDRGLEYLYDLPKLRDATFLGSQVTRQGLRQLREALQVKGGTLY